MRNGAVDPKNGIEDGFKVEPSGCYWSWFRLLDGTTDYHDGGSDYHHCFPDDHKPVPDDHDVVHDDHDSIPNDQDAVPDEHDDVSIRVSPDTSTVTTL